MLLKMVYKSEKKGYYQPHHMNHYCSYAQAREGHNRKGPFTLPKGM